MPARDWLLTLNIPWATQGTNNARYWGALGDLLDEQIAFVKQGVKARMPGLAPADALGFLGSERQLDRGPTESNEDFAARLQRAFETWARAGTPLGLLLALHYAGFTGAVLVQQNGWGFSLTPPISLDDPLASLVVTELGTNPTIEGTPPWWLFDLDDEFCSRFAVLFPGPLPALAITWATATFTGVEDDVAVTWSNPFLDASYHVIVGPPTMTAPGTIPTVDVDAGSKTATGCTVTTSDHFTGTVDLIAYQGGASPFGDLHPNDLTRLRSVIRKWRPAKATCDGVFVVAQGRTIGWPVRIIGNGTTIGASTVVRYDAA